jgi:hypothetical protein
MAIIYSYPRVNSLNSSDLLIATRFENEDNGSARTISFTADAIGGYVVANYSNTLDQVLTAGNVSLEDAKVGSIYLYNSFAPATLGYVSITGDKNAFNFFSVQGTKYAQIYNGGIFLKGIDTTFGTNIQAPNPASTTSVARFQDSSGTIAYLSDITNYGLAALTTNALPVANTTTALTLLNGTIAGTLTLLPDSLVVGDSFKLSLAGIITSVPSNDISISIKTLDGIVLAEFVNLSIGPSVSNSRWNLEATLTVRAIGAASTAAIATSAIFSSNFNAGSTLFGSVNSTTFDTTIANTLVVTAKWATASLTSFIYTQTFTLNKVY